MYAREASGWRDGRRGGRIVQWGRLFFQPENAFFGSWGERRFISLVAGVFAGRHVWRSVRVVHMLQFFFVDLLAGGCFTIAVVEQQTLFEVAFLLEPFRPGVVLAVMDEVAEVGEQSGNILADCPAEVEVLA